MVMLETMYKCCAPALYSLNWQECNHKVKAPIAAIAAFPHSSEPFHCVDLQIARWVESGGTRVTPLRSSCERPKIEQFFKDTHSLVVPEYMG